MVVIALAVVLVGVVALTYVFVSQRVLTSQGYRRGVSSPAIHPGHDFSSDDSRELIGGARVGRFNASIPLVKLQVDDECAHLSGATDVWVDRPDVMAVRAIRGLTGLTVKGIRFETEDGHLDGVIFWTLHPSKALDCFRELGWPSTD